jgi:hypothetical protein
MLGVCQPGAAAHPALDGHCVLEVRLGLVVAPERRGEHPEPARDRAEGRFHWRLCVEVPVGAQHLVEVAGRGHVAEECARLREERDAEKPFRIEVVVGEVACEQCVESAPGLVLVAELGSRVGERALEPQQRRLLMDRSADRVLELGEPALLPAQDE